MPAKNRKQPKPAPKRSNDQVIAEYHGTNWQNARCTIPRCTFTFNAANYETARAAIAEHRAAAH